MRNLIAHILISWAISIGDSDFAKNLLDDCYRIRKAELE